MIGLTGLMKFRLSFVLLLAFLVLAIIPAGSSSYRDVFIILMDMLHFPAAALLVFFLTHIIRFYLNREPLIIPFILVIICVFLLEWIQPWFGRTQDWVDVYFGLLGAVFGGLLFLIERKRLLIYRILKYLVFFIYFLYCLTQLYHLSMLFKNEAVIADFESPLELSLWRNLNHIKEPRLVLLNSVADHNSKLVKGLVLDFQWSGLTYQNSIGVDASGYNALELDYFSNNQQSIKLRLRFDDTNETIYRIKSQMVDSGWNHVVFRFDMNQDFDFKNLVKIAVFAESRNIKDYYLVDNIQFTTFQ